MALLTEAQRREATQAFIERIYVALNQRADCNSDQLKAAIDATDAWIDANSTLYVAALPLAFTTNSTAAQKTALFCMVALRRAGLL